MGAYRGEITALKARIGALEEAIADERREAQRLLEERRKKKQAQGEAPESAKARSRWKSALEWGCIVGIFAGPLLIAAAFWIIFFVTTITVVPWSATVTESHHPSVERGHRCEVIVTVHHNLVAISGSEVRILCGSVLAYDERYDEGSGPSCVLLPQRGVGPRQHTYAAVCQDFSGPGRREFPRLALDTRSGHAEIRPRDGFEHHVVLEVERESAPVDGDGERIQTGYVRLEGDR